MYNFMTCEGFDAGFLGGCSMAWLSFVIVLFLCMVVRRQCEDGVLAGMGFNLVGALILGMGSTILTVVLFGSARWALLIGIAGLVIGGFALGLIWDQAGGENE